jgi:sensor histidine kinase YesM
MKASLDKIQFSWLAERSRLWMHLLFWLGWGVLYFMISDVQELMEAGHWNGVLMAGLLFLLTAGVIVFNQEYLLPRYLFKRELITYLLILAVCIILYVLSLYLWSNTVSNITKGARRLSGVLFNANLLIFFFSLASSSFLKITRYSYREQARKDAIEKERLNLELKFLKAQLNPHFFMNTLNTLYGLAIQKSDLTPDAILQLSELMKYLLQVTKANELVTLAKEIRFTKTYLKLIHLRFDREESIRFEVKGRPGGKMVVPLLFISFLENSIEHGIGTMGKEGYVKSYLELEPNHLVFYAENNYNSGVSIRFRSSTGLGLGNIRRQLELNYPGRFDLDIQDEEELYRVRLEIRFEDFEM